MSVKYIKLLIDDTGLIVYSRIQRESDGLWYKNSDGTFAAYAQANVVALAEHADVKRTYSWNGGGSAVWPDGRYYVYSYKQIGGSPNDDNDEPLGSGVLVISDDEEVTNDVLDDELTLVKGLLGVNCVLDDFTYDGNGKATAGNLYVYNSVANANNHDKSTGLLKKVVGTAVISSGNTTKLTRTEG